MGYYVEITEADYTIPTANIEAAFEALKALNHSVPDSEKRGGSWSGGKQTAAWFSWMSEKYDEECADLGAILEELGFEFLQTEAGLSILGYDSKTGQEDLFLKALEPFALPGSYINWRGEDGWDYSTIVPEQPALDAAPTERGEYIVLPASAVS